ncbi:MAG: hypothetical protein K0R13_3661 [Propionibacteriaceae bacterium]|nr:hypothetical protein [Propionibacteriaceae bacterium]
MLACDAGSRRVSARWTFPQAQSTPHQSPTTRSPLFPAPRSDTCGSGASLAAPDLGELTTYVNDALMLAPSMLLIPALTWRAVDDDSFDISMSDGTITATSRVYVDEQGRMVDFSTTDRWAALPGGLTRTRWTTPIDG